MIGRVGGIAILVAAVAAIAAAGVALKYRLDLGAAQTRVASGSNLIQTPCGPIEYGSRGAGRAILVVHDAGGGFDQGMELMSALVAGGYRVIAPSRFGYLRTPMPADASPAAQADAYGCLLTALGIPRAGVVAGSAGAPSAMQFALRHPEQVQALVLLTPVAFAEGGAAAAHLGAAFPSDFRVWAGRYVGGDAIVRGVLATPPADLVAMDAAERSRIEFVKGRILPVAGRGLGLTNDDAIAAKVARVDLEHIAVPTLAVGVKDDLFGTYAGAEYTAAHIPGAKLVSFDKGGHVWAGHGQEVARAVIGFLTPYLTN